jgi:hypothetical protein
MARQLPFKITQVILIIKKFDLISVVPVSFTSSSRCNQGQARTSGSFETAGTAELEKNSPGIRLIKKSNDRMTERLKV